MKKTERLDEVGRAAKDRPPAEPAEAGQTLLPAELTTAPEPKAVPFGDLASRRPQPEEERIDVESVFAKLKQLKRGDDDA